MKNIIPFCLALFFTITATSQNLFLVTFANTKDKDIGKGCLVDQFNINNAIERISQSLGYDLKELNYPGTGDFNSANFESFLSKIQSTSNDIIIFYLTSHGARSATDKTHYPQIFINGEYKSVIEKYTLMQKIPHRTLLTIIDACNVVRKISAKETTIFSKTYDHDITSQITEIEKTNVKKIFVENNFDLIVTSSQVGVTSISTSDGSVFTNNFISSFNYYFRSSNTALASIDNVLARSYNNTLNESKRLYKNHPDKLPLTAESKPHFPMWTLDKKTTFFLTKDVSPASFEITYEVKKHNRWFSKNDYEVILKITADSELMSQVKDVKYILHHTFNEPIVTAIDKAYDYKYTLWVWGEFLLRSEVTLNDGTVVDLAKELIFPD